MSPLSALPPAVKDCEAEGLAFRDVYECTVVTHETFVDALCACGHQLLVGFRHRWVTASLHVVNQCISEFATFYFRGALHQAGKIVGHSLAGDGFVHRRENAIGGLAPAQVAQHHFA